MSVCVSGWRRWSQTSKFCSTCPQFPGSQQRLPSLLVRIYEYMLQPFSFLQLKLLSSVSTLTLLPSHVCDNKDHTLFTGIPPHRSSLLGCWIFGIAFGCMKYSVWFGERNLNTSRFRHTSYQTNTRIKKKKKAAAVKHYLFTPECLKQTPYVLTSFIQIPVELF